MQTEDGHERETNPDVKRDLVAETITSHVSHLATKFDDFKAISSALDNGDELIVETISGGCTNFSYKVYLRGTPDVALFAKLSFAYALWNPDPDVPYDLDRTENEFAMMKRVSEMMEDAPIATPYLCVDVQKDMKLLVTEWCESDEQWANQFIDGVVDERIVPKLAQTLALLHLADFDPEFNANVRPCMLTVFPAMKDKLKELNSLPAGDGGRVADLAKSYGQDICDEIIDRNLANYNERNCLVHSDAHAFNILVEKKPDVSSLERFGPKGDVVLCDWEMAFAGPIGRDIGLSWSWPLSCLLAHAANGHAYSVDDSFLHIIEQLWDEYSNVLVRKGNKDEAFLCKTYRNCIAWCGWFVFLGTYVLRCQTDFLPIDEAASEEDKDAMFDAIGVLGLKLLHLGYIDDEDDDEELMIEDYRDIFRGILLREIEELDERVASKRKMAMRMSVLRTTGRRISDAALHFSLNRKKMDVQFRGSILEVLEN